MTTVRPLSRFGVVELDADGTVAALPREAADRRARERGVLRVRAAASSSYLTDDSVLEQEPLEALAGDGQLVAYRHDGFWQPMDTYREFTMLNELWASGQAPWKVWSRMTWADRSVLVTGATGFVGSWLTRRLVDDGADVVALVLDARPAVGARPQRHGRPRQRASTARSRTPARWHGRSSAHEVDTVFHLGAQTIVGTAHRDPVATFEANIRGTYELLDVARRHADLVRRVVVASSDKAYGEQPAAAVHRRHAARRAATRTRCRSRAPTSSRSRTRTTYGLPVAIARCGNIYGGGDLNWSRIVPGTIRSLLRGEQPVHPQRRHFVRDYLHVDDVVDAYLALADWLGAGEPTWRGAAFNFSDETPLTVLEIYDAVCDAAGRAASSPRSSASAPGEIHDQYLDAARARRELLGWKAQVELRDGLDAHRRRGTAICSDGTLASRERRPPSSARQILGLAVEYHDEAFPPTAFVPGRHAGPGVGQGRRRRRARGCSRRRARLLAHRGPLRRRAREAARRHRRRAPRRTCATRARRPTCSRSARCTRRGSANARCGQATRSSRSPPASRPP